MRVFWRILIVVLALALLGAGSGLVLALRGEEASPGPADEEWVTQAVSEFLNIPNEELAVTLQGYADGRVRAQVLHQRDGETKGRYYARLDPQSREVTTMSWPVAAGEKGEEISQEAARGVAEQFLAERGEPLSEMSLLRQRQLWMSGYEFGWYKLRDGIMTGDLVAVMVSPGGQVRSYVSVKAAREVLPEEVKITRQRAESIALALARRQARPGLRVEVKEATLILSYRLAPRQGPVWAVSVRFVGPEEGQAMAANTLFIDARTGEEIPLGPQLTGGGPGS